ncbi:cyclodeaminase/cyclohydrolase family protein [Zhaonella formicivorans]|uniref:cyclodeaminase/cyclohydrolase family protein n=1 Tax=Zhaonella formicivorans TaxID=2528593 RepID=UPI0010D56630|nr:cyclodeaminase/cyclohydrolase family protein [Zhaonella formicivorans]
MLIDLKCNEFIEELASASPAPGGGSVSALAGALGAALVSMVANLTIGKEQFKADEEELQAVLAKASELKEKLMSYVDEDTEAFNRVMTAYKLPKGTEEEKKARTQAIQEAMRQAASLPMEVAECCLEALQLTKTAVAKGNPNALSDGGVAVLMAFAGLQGAIFNVQINLGSIKDEQFVQTMREKKEHVLRKGQALRDEILAMVETKLN